MRRIEDETELLSMRRIEDEITRENRTSALVSGEAAQADLRSVEEIE
jgi:hypothetical protein